jgi:hypothetical protein
MVALSTYLENRPDLESIAKAMIAAANELLAGDKFSGSHSDDLVVLDLESSTDIEIARSSAKDADAQLTLL